MSEEIQNASTIVPYSLLASITLNGFLGFGMLLAVLFCLGDLQAALDSPTGYPFMEIFLQATHSAAGSSVMITIVTVLQICATIACLAGSSRMTWSFARDHGLPGWRILSKVSSISVHLLILLLLFLLQQQRQKKSEQHRKIQTPLISPKHIR